MNGGGGGLMESSARGALSVNGGEAHLVTLKGLTLDRPLHQDVCMQRTWGDRVRMREKKQVE